eukprot:gene3398-3724_t
MALLNNGRVSRIDAVHLMAGVFILGSLALYYWVSIWFLIVPTFVGANLFQFGLTGFCPAEFVFGLLGLPEHGPCSYKGLAPSSKELGLEEKKIAQVV